MKHAIYFFLTLGLGSSLYYNYHLSSDLQEKASLLEKEKIALEHAENTAHRFKKIVEGERVLQENTVTALRAQLDQAKQNFSVIEDRYNRAHNTGTGGEDLSWMPDAIQKQKDVVTDLEMQLKEIHANRDQVNTSKNASIDQSKWNLNLTREELDASIQSENDTILNLTHQQNELRPHSHDYGVKDQIQQLGSQINTEKANLKSLKEQKAYAIQYLSNQQNGIHAQAGKSLNDLKVSEIQIGNQLAQEKSKLVNLEQKQKQQTQSHQSQQKSLDQLNQSYQDQKQKIQQIEAQLKKEQDRLAELSE